MSGMHLQNQCKLIQRLVNQLRQQHLLPQSERTAQLLTQWMIQASLEASSRPRIKRRWQLWSRRHLHWKHRVPYLNEKALKSKLLVRPNRIRLLDLLWCWWLTELLINSYYNIVKRTMIDMVPKAIMLNLVQYVSEGIWGCLTNLW